MGDAGGMDHGGGTGVGAMQADSGCISKVELTGCGEQSDTRVSENKG